MPETYGVLKMSFEKAIADLPALEHSEEAKVVKEILNAMKDRLGDEVSNDAKIAAGEFCDRALVLAFPWPRPLGICGRVRRVVEE